MHTSQRWIVQGLLVPHGDWTKLDRSSSGAVRISVRMRPPLGSTARVMVSRGNRSSRGSNPTFGVDKGLDPVVGVGHYLQEYRIKLGRRENRLVGSLSQ